MKFFKYQGAGNDFVMLDQRTEKTIARGQTAEIARLCDRRFGIGADGLILLQTLDGYDFEMVYFNADGRESTMCGNGGRCIAAFAHDLGIVGSECRFLAIDGAHEARIGKQINPHEYWVELKMNDVQNIDIQGNTYILNTGSPHYVRFENTVEHLDMVSEGRAVRYSERFQQEGINVNLVAPDKTHGLDIRTYERGVEDETLACGTGVTAAAIAQYFRAALTPGKHEIPVHARGGELSVRYTADAAGHFTDVWLCGPAAYVFSGEI